jgi:hypothetical protein
VIDRVAGAGATGARAIEETVVAPIALGPISIGDLLVLARDPAMVLVYPLRGTHGIQDVLADPCVNCERQEPIELVADRPW